MKIRGHPIDLMVDTGAEHSVVSQPVAPVLSQKHTTIIRDTGGQAQHPFLVSI
jgi:predicted aspartyl protease